MTFKNKIDTLNSHQFKCSQPTLCLLPIYTIHPPVTRDIPRFVMIVAELCDLRVYCNILHTPHTLTQARSQPRALGGSRHLPQGGALPCPDGHCVSLAPLPQATYHLPPPHLLCGAFWYRDRVTVHKLSAPGVPVQSFTLTLLSQTHRVKVEISRVISLGKQNIRPGIIG